MNQGAHLSEGSPYSLVLVQVNQGVHLSEGRFTGPSTSGPGNQGAHLSEGRLVLVKWTRGFCLKGGSLVLIQVNQDQGSSVQAKGRFTGPYTTEPGGSSVCLKGGSLVLIQLNQGAHLSEGRFTGPSTSEPGGSSV